MSSGEESESIPLPTVSFSDYVEYYNEAVGQRTDTVILFAQDRMSPVGLNHLTNLEGSSQMTKTTNPDKSFCSATPGVSHARGRGIKIMEEFLLSRRSRGNGEVPTPVTYMGKFSDAGQHKENLDVNSINTPDTKEDNHTTIKKHCVNDEASSKLAVLENSVAPQCMIKDKKSSELVDKPISCVPAGMLIQAKPKQRMSVPYQPSFNPQRPVERKQPPTTFSSQQFHEPVQSRPFHRHENLAENSLTLQPSSFGRGKLLGVASGQQLNLQFSNTLKSALQQVDTLEKSPGHQLLSPHAEPSLPQSPDQQDDLDMEKLFQLASAAIDRSSSIDDNSPHMLKLSKLAELIEEGRVLVSSDVPHSPTHNLKDFPFERLIYESLHSFVRCEKPKTIQAYVWDPILRGHNVVYISGSRTGKTLGYLIPILNNVLDQSSYLEVPSGCSPLVVVICSSWENAETVNNYCCRLLHKVQDFRSAVFADCTPQGPQIALPNLINGVTLLATTAPAMKLLLEESKGVVGFDRCCHLIFDDTDIILRDHGEAMKDLFSRYQESVRRMSVNSFVPRQIVACASHWTKGIEILSSKAMNSPSIFISSCMEAAIYGGMKLYIHQGDSQEMDSHLLKIMKEKHLTRTIIFCRGSAEVSKVDKMLTEIGLPTMLAHNQSIISDLDYLTSKWNNSEPGSSILICTDDVLERLDIKNAQTLIHYYIPHHSKYDFSYRLSFAMGCYKLNASDAERPETHLMLTKEFNNSLLTIVRFMHRFGYKVSDQLATDAILSYCGKEARKKNLPLCEILKAYGDCRNIKFCGYRHVILKSLDQPTVPRNGIVRIRITAVRTATRYFARILKHSDESGRLVDLTGSLLKIGAQLRDHFKNGSEQSTLAKNKIEIGQLYAMRLSPDLFERVRVESILAVDHQGNPVEVSVEGIDLGSVMTCFVNTLFELPTNLKTHPPEAIEIFLVGAYPMDRNSTWSRNSIQFVYEKIMGKELEGRVVLALSSTLWLQPLQERKRLDGLKSVVVVGDILKDLFEAQLAEKNADHLSRLHHLCETGGIDLPDIQVGLMSKTANKPVEAARAFLPLDGQTEVEVVTVDSPHQFYLVIHKFRQTLRFLEDDIRKKISICKSLTYEGASEGSFCLAESPAGQGLWCRCQIKKKIAEDGGWIFQVFYLDYGDYATFPLSKLRNLPDQFIARLPFQAIACSLDGVCPRSADGKWAEEEIDNFVALTTDDDGCMDRLHVEVKRKGSDLDQVTNGPHYYVTLTNRQKSEPKDLASALITQNVAKPVNECDRTIPNSVEPSKPIEKQVQTTQFDIIEDEMKFDVSADCMELVIQSLATKPQSASQSATPTASASATPTRPEKSLNLIDYAMPHKEEKSLFPTTKWSQNSEDVYLTFFLKSVGKYSLEFSENHLSFATTVGKSKYELHTTTYGFIVPNQCSHTTTDYGIKVTLRKRDAGCMWNRLVQSPNSQPWLTRDFTSWESGFESENEKEDDVPLVTPKYAFEDEQSVSSSSDTDLECADEMWLQDDD